MNGSGNFIDTMNVEKKAINWTRVGFSIEDLSLISLLIFIREFNRIFLLFSYPSSRSRVNSWFWVKDQFCM